MKEYLHSALLGIFAVKYAEAVIWYVWVRYGSNYVIGKKFIFIWSEQTMKKIYNRIWFYDVETTVITKIWKTLVQTIMYSISVF